MDYEKTYKAALERAKKFHSPESNNSNLKAVIEQIFPELAESDDERIRKGLIQYLQDDMDCQPCQDVSFYEEAIAWLEKQKEQKPSTEETELNSIAFLEQMGYTCIPPSAQQPIEWHPTHEQMVALNWAANGIDNNSPCAGDIKASLRSLYNNLQSKSIRHTEWSEEDEMLMDELESYILYDKEFNDEQKAWRIKKLKSLRSQPHWKPSEEQMEALKDVIDSASDSYKFRCTLVSLFNDLNALKEE